MPGLLALIASAKPDAPVTLQLANRDIVVLRASVLGRSSADRVASAESQLGYLVSQGAASRAAFRPVETAFMVAVDGHDVFAILPADVDELGGETIEAKTQAAVAHLQQALDEITEAHSPRRLLSEALIALGFTAILLAVLWIVRRVDRVTARWVASITERRLSASKEAAAAIARQARLSDYAQRAVHVASIVVVAVTAYWWLVAVLRRFPYTRPWGDAMRGYLLSEVAWLGRGVLDAIPGLVTVALIVLFARLLVRLVRMFFDAVEHGRISVPWIFPETAAPTRKLLTGLVWLFALIVSYPHLPGSSTDAFKGVSVFVGLVVSLGSTGLVGQVMSGLTATYSRALRVGDYVRLGDVEGTVTHLGTLSVKLETPWREAVTVPNTVVISREVTNYSRAAGGTTALASTSVTIGYDAPWRQVEAMLLAAAARTPGLRREPQPFVLQTALEDFYVRYTLLAMLDDPRTRVFTLAALHANIQDAFNEYGVQIMSPHYLGDPHAPKVVPKDRWAPPPAKGGA